METPDEIEAVGLVLLVRVPIASGAKTAPTTGRATKSALCLNLIHQSSKGRSEREGTCPGNRSVVPVREGAKVIRARLVFENPRNKRVSGGRDVQMHRCGHYRPVLKDMLGNQLLSSSSHGYRAPVLVVVPLLSSGTPYDTEKECEYYILERA